MTVRVKKFLLGLCLLFLVMIIPQQAEAININLENPYSDTLWAAVIYYEDSASKWVTRGWYKVEPYNTRNLNFSSSTKRDSVYIYAYTSEASWGGEGENAVKRTVIKEPFKYYDGESCPAGSNRRQVSFDRWYTENGVVYWSP
ncbi:hypothetical protein SDC9_03951 [bioreactor metagenome]|uniref:Uncharacterized protein n=1 Tax=bioreactor metagenome TaxID=1076179 RepID=A0A644SUP2_9ZZZZ|nr:DUF1036 domain-containing protein [Negativicutes bacterium]